MAEAVAAIGILASITQLADYGFKLSVKLFTFSQAVSTADQSIRIISNDVSLTSTVLKELSQIIASDETHMVSDNAVEATRQTVAECLMVFEELSNALDKSLGNLGMLDGNEKRRVRRGTAALEKLKWPFKQSKMELVRSNLDRLKASLTLMLQVLTYARDVSNRKVAEASLMQQQYLIESLAISERTIKRRYLALEKAAGNEGLPWVFTTSSNFVDTTSTRDIQRVTPPPFEDRTPPVVGLQPLIGELFLCFCLLDNLLIHHAHVIKSQDQSSLGYEEQLWNLLHKIQEVVQKRTEQGNGFSPHVKAQAARNLQARLSELARGVFPVPQEVNEDLVTESDPTTSPQAQRSYVADQPVEPPEPFGIPPESNKTSPVSSPLCLLPDPAAAPIAPPPASMQAEIDATLDAIRENIEKVTTRGERLDTLQDTTGNLPESSQEFRRAALRMRRQGNPWTWTYDAVAKTAVTVASESYKAIRSVSDVVYEAGRAVFVDSDGETAGGRSGATTISGDGIEYAADEDTDEEFDSDEDVVERLLSAWTNLPEQKLE